MEAIVLVVVVVVGGGMVAVLAMAARRPRLRPQEEVARVSRPAVRVLESDDELASALRQAARFERDEADVRRRRADRYEAQISVPPIADLHRDRRPPAPPASGHPRSA
jgi:hypothetical protein